MASYAEISQVLLLEIDGAKTLLQLIQVGVLAVAEDIRTESGATNNHANRLIWAKQANENSASKAESMFASLLAQNISASQSAILGASDTTIKTNVADAVDIFADGS